MSVVRSVLFACSVQCPVRYSIQNLPVCSVQRVGEAFVLLSQEVLQVERNPRPDECVSPEESAQETSMVQWLCSWCC